MRNPTILQSQNEKNVPKSFFVVNTMMMQKNMCNKSEIGFKKFVFKFLQTI